MTGRAIPPERAAELVQEWRRIRLEWARQQEAGKLSPLDYIRIERAKRQPENKQCI